MADADDALPFRNNGIWGLVLFPMRGERPDVVHIRVMSSLLGKAGA